MKILFVLWSLFFVPVFAEDSLASLDAKRVKENLSLPYRNFFLKPGSVWTVNWVGRTRDWTWNGTKGWSCTANDTEFVNCADWVPVVLQWSSVKMSVLGLEPLQRIGFEMGKPKIITHPISPAIQNIIETDTPGLAEDENVKAFSSQRWASEVWETQVPQGDKIKLYISLRSQSTDPTKNHWIDRIDHGNFSEMIEWAQDQNSKQLMVERIIMENGQEMLSFKRK